MCVHCYFTTILSVAFISSSGSNGGKYQETVESYHYVRAALIIGCALQPLCPPVHVSYGRVCVRVHIPRATINLLRCALWLAVGRLYAPDKAPYCLAMRGDTCACYCALMESAFGQHFCVPLCALYRACDGYIDARAHTHTHQCMHVCGRVAIVAAC